MTSSLSRNSIEKQADFQKRISDYLQHSTWSIAFGALLLNNVLPPARCTKVPEEASCLVDQSAPASSRQLNGAREVMRKWAEGFDEDEFEGELPQETSPQEFLEWAYENLDHDPAWAPPLLNYFTSLVRPAANLILPEEVIRRLVAIDNREVSPPHAERGADSSSSFVNGESIPNRIYKLIDDDLIRTPIAADIARALVRLSHNPAAIKLPVVVWNELIVMAKSGEKGLSVRYSKDHMLEFMHDGNWIPYLRERLAQVLMRIREKLEAQSQSD